MSDHYTASQIHEVLCRADGLEPTKQTAILNRVRYLAKRELLKNGNRIDERRTLSFPMLEVYRAAIFCDLAGLAMDVRALAPITDAADRVISLAPTQPPSLRVDWGWQSLGGLLDSIRGVDAGEQWWLLLQYRLPDRLSSGGLRAEFLWDGTKDPAVEKTLEQYFGRKPTRTFARIDLKALFGNIIPLVGVPD